MKKFRLNVKSKVVLEIRLHGSHDCASIITFPLPFLFVCEEDWGRIQM